MNDNNELKKIKKELEKIKSEYPIRLSRFQFKIGLLVILTYFTYTFATSITTLNVFSNGQVISAQDMNDNFDYLEGKVDNLGKLIAIVKMTGDTGMTLTGSYADFSSMPFDDITIIDNSIMSQSGVTFTFNETGTYRVLGVTKWSTSMTYADFYNTNTATSTFGFSTYEPEDKYFQVTTAGHTYSIRGYMMTPGATTIYDESFFFVYQVYAD